MESETPSRENCSEHDAPNTTAGTNPTVDTVTVFTVAKGYHCEVFFDGVVPIKKLNLLNHIILAKHKETGGAHIDCIYPANKAYRIFGCFHYKTQKFTEAVEISVCAETGEVGMERLNYADSWERFAAISPNPVEVIDEIIAANPNIIAPPGKDKRTIQREHNYTPKTVYYDKTVIKQIHETGLYGEYRRHHSAFQLGRYFKHVLRLSKYASRERNYPVAQKAFLGRVQRI